MLGEYQLMWIQCDDECHLEKLASVASIPPVVGYQQVELIMMLITFAGRKTSSNDSIGQRHFCPSEQLTNFLDKSEALLR